MEFPTRLKDDRIKFCRVLKNSKKPFEEGWTSKLYTWQDIEKFYPKENYGVLCGQNGLNVIDVDNLKLKAIIERNLPKTFTVKTGGGGLHYYYFIPTLKKRIILEEVEEDNKVTHLGEIQSLGQQVVGAGSLHKNGNYYEVIEDEEIATITLEQVYQTLGEFIKELKDIEQVGVQENKNFQSSEIDKIDLLSIWGSAGLKKNKDQYFGSHPIHDSTTGMNFWINTSKNTWYCHRHQAGGGVMSAIAVKHGLIDCSESVKGKIRGDLAKRCVQIARDEYGLKLEDGFVPIHPSDLKEMTYDQKKYFAQYLQPSDVISNERDKVKLLWDEQLEDYKDDKTWIIDRLIPTKSVGVWTGKRGTFKTFLVLNAVCCVASGKNFLDKFPTKQGKVIYLDKENGIPIMRQRKNMIKKGLGVETALPVGFICFSSLKIDKLKDIITIEEFIKEHKPSLLVVDTYRRGISFEENDAGQVSKLFVDILRPIVERHDISIILIHHDKKGEDNGDEMDMIRGSSDLANYCDFILKNDRKGDVLVLKQLKMRNAPEKEPVKIKMETDEETFIKFTHEGEFEEGVITHKATEAIILWMVKDNVRMFPTEDAFNQVSGSGIKEGTFKIAINELINAGIIKRVSRGFYEVIKIPKSVTKN